MVLRLSTVLEVPLRQSNELLRAAGYASVWTETNLGAPTLAPIRDALDYMLTQHEPLSALSNQASSSIWLMRWSRPMC